MLRLFGKRRERTRSEQRRRMGEGKQGNAMILFFVRPAFVQKIVISSDLFSEKKTERVFFIT
jgi:hypothetical protein